MTTIGMTGYRCLLPFNFEDPIYVQIDNMVLDYGMGLDSDYLFECALSVMFELKTIDDIMNYLDDVVFPEHVPNDSLSTCLSLCIGFINYVVSKLIGFKGPLNLLVTNLNRVSLHKYSSTVSVNINVEN